VGESMRLLFVNACVRAESRTLRLANKLLQKMNETYDEVCLKDIQFPVVDEKFLNEREHLVSEEEFSNPILKLAKQFAEAEEIVIAAPYWDLSFPAALKQYLEQINVVGITFKYSEEGVPVGLCKAKRLFVVSTAGGFYAPEEYGFGYIKALAENYYGIKDVRHIKALGLDIVGADEEKILLDAEKYISECAEWIYED
jgi:FMN-dependent NADH-azoreductase